MTEPLLPGAVPATCQCCHRPVPTGRLHAGYGEKCARRRGLIPPRQPRDARAAVVVQDGPDLFDAANQPEHATDDGQSGIMYAVSPDERGGLVQETEQGEQSPPAGDNPLARTGQEAVNRLYRDLSPAIEAFVRDAGFALTEWQKKVVAGMAKVQVIQPRRHSFSAQMESLVRSMGFLPLVPGRQAAILEQHGLSEGVHFLRYGDPDMTEMDEPHTGREPNPDEPPTDPMARALWLKKRRNTGPPPGRLDGRRRR